MALIYEFVTREEFEAGARPRVGTVVRAADGGSTEVFMSEERLFRSVLGDEEFERRRDEQRAKDLRRYEEWKNLPPKWWEFWR